jgi:hypothetical protein
LFDSRQTCAPKIAPMPAVTAIASAPQNTTRRAAFAMRASPALAPTAPRTTRNARDATDTVAVSKPAGVTSAINRGGTAPAENAAADARAAWIGRAAVISEIPSSSREGGTLKRELAAAPKEVDTKALHKAEEAGYRRGYDQGVAAMLTVNERMLEQAKLPSV